MKDNKLKRIIIIVLSILLMVSLIVLDIIYGSIKSKNKPKITSKPTTTPKISENVKTILPPSKNDPEMELKMDQELDQDVPKDQVTEDSQSNFEDSQIGAKSEKYLFETLSKNYIESEIIAINGNSIALKNMIDENSEYGKDKLNDVEELNKKGIKKDLKLLSYEKHKKDNDITKIYIKANIGIKNKDDKEFKYTEYKIVYKVENKEESYIFVGEDTW